MTVISIAHANIVHSRSISKGGASAQLKARKILVTFLVFAIVISGFLYVMQSNSSTAKGYKIRTLKNQLSDLQKINEGRQITISNMKSINFLQTQAGGLNMVQVQTGEIDYLALPSVNVAAVN
jgi:uncharacterized protein HemX